VSFGCRTSLSHAIETLHRTNLRTVFEHARIVTSGCPRVLLVTSFGVQDVLKGDTIDTAYEHLRPAKVARVDKRAPHPTNFRASSSDAQQLYATALEWLK
jgi:hypothetical protein